MQEVNRVAPLSAQHRPPGVPGIAKKANLRLENADKLCNAVVMHFLRETSDDEVSGIFARCVPFRHLPHGIVLRITKHMPTLVPTSTTPPRTYST